MLEFFVMFWYSYFNLILCGISWGYSLFNHVTRDWFVVVVIMQFHAVMQESQKVALAESTGLDLKQINNWFINQRKRHWKPSEDMQFVVMDATHPHYYMDNIMCNPFPMDCTPMLL